VHSNVATFSGAILLLARLAGVPGRVAHFRSDGDQHADTPPRRLQRALMRWLILRCATNVIGNAPGALAFADAKGGVATGAVIPDGVRLGPEPGQRQTSELSVVHVARSLPTKRRVRAVEVVAAARRSGLPVRLRLIGSVTDQEQDELEALAEALGVGSAVEITGPTPEVAAALRAADVLLVTSTREGLPGVVMEALAEGCPVVSTDLPGAAFIAGSCQGVILVDPAAPDHVWVDALDAALGPDAPARQSIWESFGQSPFTVDHAAAEMGSLWQASV